MAAVSAVAFSAGLAATGASTLVLLTATAAQAATVSRIEVRGNVRVDSSVIVDYVGIRPGRSFSAGDIDEALKRLFATGLFADVQINQIGGALVVIVQEYQVVNQVLFQGNRKIKDVDLAGKVQVQPRGVYNPDAIEQDAEAVREAYRKIGRSDVTVSVQAIELGEGRVNVVFEISEGGRTKISSVNFIGNSAFSDRRLADVLTTRRSGLMSWLSRDDVYDEAKLQADEEALRRFYYNRGYADFQVISSVAELDEASNKYTITVTVEEGERYRFGPITVESTVEGIDANDLGSMVETREGNVYSAKDVEDTIIGITERVAGKGFAFAQVTPRGDRDFENRTISVTYTIDQGPRTYVERIEIRGNDRTRDYVIRREFDLAEGDAFNQVLVQRAKRRLEALGFFQSVNIATAPGSEADQVVLVVDVVEQSTGEFSVGAGYATGDTATQKAGFSVEISVTEKNFLGRGQFVKVAVGGGKDTRSYALSFTEPYFLGHRIAVGFDIERNTTKESRYDVETTGFTLRTAAPITESLSATLSYNLTRDIYAYNSGCNDNADAVFGDCTIAASVANGIAASPWLKSSVTGALVWNSIDNMNNPRDGLYARFGAEGAGIWGDARFVKLTARGTYYKTLMEEQDVVGVLAAGAGYMQAFGDGRTRVFDQFQSNDRMIRGFKYNGIGPYDTATGEHVGGTTYFNASAEVQFPLPAIPMSYGLRGALFADAATLYGTGNDGGGTAFADAGVGMAWRASIGASVLWASPLGPLRFDYAVPVLKQTGDKIQRFSFGMSTRF